MTTIDRDENRFRVRENATLNFFREVIA